MIISILQLLAVAEAIMYVCLYTRSIPKNIMVYHFGITIASGFLWLYIVCLPLFFANKFGLLSKADMHKYSTMLGNIMLFSVRSLNPQLVTKTDYARCKWTDIPDSAHVLFNHMSFWDSLAYTAEVPLSVSWTKKTLMKSTMEKTPIAGQLFFKILGHFPVHFAAPDKSEDFKVDMAKQEQVSKDIDKWLNQDHKGLGYCPEGKMGSNPSVVQSLRFGMLKVVAANGGRVFICTQWNNEKFWPIGAPVGGLPADCAMTLAEYKYKDGKEECPRNEQGEIDIGLYATDMQAFMQREVDRLKAICEKKGK